MLTTQENELLTRIEGNAPMGQYLRRFWTPFAVTDDLPGPDCDPMRVRLFGEDLLAIRDTDGRAGLMTKYCSHRRADLFFGRNEEGGIRCTYHGWKYDVTGQCLDAPTEPKDSNFAAKIQIKAYPVEERAGVLWTYMGPPSLPEALEGRPDLPDFEFMHAPEGHIYSSWSSQDCNYAQAVEGGIDTVHSIYLHSMLDSHRKLDQWKQEGARVRDAQQRYRTRDNPPRLYAEDTDYGVLIGGKYVGAEGEDYWRYNVFLLPFYTMPPGSQESKACHAFVPIDDYTTARWSISWNLGRPFTSRELADLRKGSGIHAALVPGTHKPVMNSSNDYLIDREEQRKYSFTGIGGIGEQDFSVQEGMGPICDRTEEHLGVTDVGIIQMRRRLMKEARDLQEGTEPFAAGHGDVYRIHAGDTLMPSEVEDWVNAEKTQAALAAKF